jgi:hypothetical protein
MPTSKKKTKKVCKPKIFVAGKFHSTPVTIGKKFITIRLPKKVAEYFELDKNEIFWSPVNGVIQLSGSQPHIVIPMMSVTPDRFVAQ